MEISEKAIEAFIKEVDTTIKNVGTKHKDEIVMQLKEEMNSGEPESPIWVHDGIFGELLCTVKFENDGKEVTAIHPDFTVCTL